MNSQGCIQLIIGPMFSGKSTELQRRIRRHAISKRSCIAVKHYQDTRCAADEVATHDKQLLKATAAASLKEVMPLLMKHEVIGIDEGQFFSDACF